MTTATDSLAALAHLTVTTRIGDLPEAVTGKARHHLLDTLGAALAGADSTETTAVLRMLTTTEPTAGPGTPVWGTGLALSPRGAALANGVSAHALELDDTGGCDHSGAVVVPAALAAVSAAPAPVSGADLLTAVVVGYDIARRVLEACGGYWPHNEAGWHSTGTCGPFGAAAAAAAILRLDADRTMHALALAGSLSAGIWAFIHDGAMSKRLHAGRAAEAGVTAALLAAHGVTGPARIFDDVWGGFLSTFAPAGAEPAALTAGLGREWRISRCSLKPYASCRSTHSSVDAVGAVLDRHGLGADDVADIHVRLNRAVYDMCGGTDVTTLAAAQLSLAYAVAARIAFGGAGLDTYDEEKRHSPRVRSVLERIVLEVDPAMDSDTEPVVTVVTRTGARHEQHVADPLGSPTNPLDGPAVRAKFDGLAARALPPNRVRAVADTVQRIESLADATALMSLLGRQNRR
ncbi:MmgE/PrpD family protein [Streptomyces antimycoticus]|uniref:MmgE/PrpD family protein n=1 Tax=Streptomyces antimycoticus TaxID=68175 RepID=UPI003675768B